MCLLSSICIYTYIGSGFIYARLVMHGCVYLSFLIFPLLYHDVRLAPLDYLYCYLNIIRRMPALP